MPLFLWKHVKVVEGNEVWGWICFQMILCAILANFYDFFQKSCKDAVSGLKILILGKWDMWATVIEYD